MQKNNLVRKVMSGVSGLALLVSLEGCATTIPHSIIHQDPTTKTWYDCNTSVDYPVEHPCYSVVAEYNAVHKSSSSNEPYEPYEWKKGDRTGAPGEWKAGR